MYAHVYVDRLSYMDMYMNGGWIMGDDDDNDDDGDGDDDDDDDHDGDDDGDENAIWDHDHPTW